MANYQALDAQGDTIDFAADGAGTTGDPHISHHRVTDIDAGASPDIGATGDAEVTGNGSLIAIVKRLRTLLNGGLPAALGQGTAAQGMKVALASDQHGPWTPHKLISAATTNATSVKASAGRVGLLYVSNLNGAPRYFKLYNKASAPTVGTDTPVQVYQLPGNSAGSGVILPIPDGGLNFTTGIAYALTAGIADSDTSAVAASEHVVNMGYL